MIIALCCKYQKSEIVSFPNAIPVQKQDKQLSDREIVKTTGKMEKRRKSLKIKDFLL